MGKRACVGALAIVAVSWASACARSDGADGFAPVASDASDGDDGGEASTGAGNLGDRDAGPGDAGASLDGRTEPDDASAPGDDASEGSRPDASDDDGEASANPNDASSDGALPVTCGGAVCFAGQSCVAGTCAFETCVGAHVPGDYATVQGAITGLASTGGTLCLGAQTYEEWVDTKTAQPMTIQGVSSGQTVLKGLTANGAMALTLRGLEVRTVYLDGTGTASLSAMAVGGYDVGEPGFTVRPSTGALSVTLDGVDATGDVGHSQPAIQATLSNAVPTDLTLLVQNSYVHGAATGLRVLAQASATGHLTFVNDTFASNGTALDLTLGSGLPVAMFNDLIVNNTLGLTFPQPAVSTQGANAFFGNTNNYGGTAADGAGYVKTDPLLDTSTTPPGLHAGSPCRGAGDRSHAPSTDFHGRPRGAKVDIGAVQSP